MLTIRPAQLAVFEQASWQNFVGRATALLLRESASAFVGTDVDQHERRCAWALARGRRHGLHDGAALVQFATCVLSCGPRFEAHPAVRALLARGADTAEQRLAHLLHGLPDRVWEELALMAPDADWSVISEDLDGRGN